MKFSIKKEVAYIPKWNDNDKDAEPITFYLRPLTVTERDEIFSPTADETGKAYVKLNQIRSFKLGVIRIENLIVDNKPITTAAQLLQLGGFYECMLEVAREIITMNNFNEDELKN